MAYTFLIFEFGANEEAAQQARHKIDGWKQGFRLGHKLLSKFQRTEFEGDAAAAKSPAAETSHAAAKSGKHEERHEEKGKEKGKHAGKDAGGHKGKEVKGAHAGDKKGAHAGGKKTGDDASAAASSAGASPAAESADAADIRMIVRLDFSDHEKLSFQRWLERIPKEEPFHAAHGKIVKPGEAEYAKITDQFDSLS
jgi:hypothetical protein